MKLSATISIRGTSFRLAYCRLGELAVFLRPRLPNAVDARCVALTNRFLHREERWLAVQMQAARNVEYFVILVLRYCDRLRYLTGIALGRGRPRVVRRQDQPPD